MYFRQEYDRNSVLSFSVLHFKNHIIYICPITDDVTLYLSKYLICWEKTCHECITHKFPCFPKILASGRAGISGVLFIQLKQSQGPNLSEFKGEEMDVVPRLAALAEWFDVASWSVGISHAMVSLTLKSNGFRNKYLRTKKMYLTQLKIWEAHFYFPNSIVLCSIKYTCHWPWINLNIDGILHHQYLCLCQSFWTETPLRQ